MFKFVRTNHTLLCYKIHSGTYYLKYVIIIYTNCSYLDFRTNLESVNCSAILRTYVSLNVYCKNAPYEKGIFSGTSLQERWLVSLLFEPASMYAAPAVYTLDP